MEGDKVSIVSTATDVDGQAVLTTEVSPKPQFMLDEEYHEQVIDCACQSIISACRIVYPNNPMAQINLAKMIAKKIENEMD